MSTKDVNAIIHKLEEECLLKHQNVPMESSMWKCYYIDFQSSINAIRLRIHCLEKRVKMLSDRGMLVTFTCPTCSSEYSELEVQRLRTKDFCFACERCCSVDNMRSIVSEDYFRLVKANNVGSESDCDSLERKLKEQLLSSSDHDGILDLLNELNDVPLPRNYPSDSIHQVL